MKAADLDILLQEGEGVMLEYKEGLSASFARELVALANTAGGRILRGFGMTVRSRELPIPISYAPVSRTLPATVIRP
jgi:predicted HTH transcriptional regulator